MGIPNASTIHSQLYLLSDSDGHKIRELKQNQKDYENYYNKLPTGQEKTDLGQVIQRIKDTIIQIEEGKILDFVLNPLSPLRDKKLIFVDEASMVGGRLKQDLESVNKNIIYCGDNFQLPPIETGSSALFDERGSPLTPDALLTEIVRQNQNNPIIEAATALRTRKARGLPYEKMKTSDGVIIPVDEESLDEKHLVLTDQILCGYNRTRKYLNEWVREYLERPSPYPINEDKLLIQRNHHARRLFNGQCVYATTNATFVNPNEFSLNIKTEEGLEINEVSMGKLHFLTKAEEIEKYNKIPSYIKRRLVEADYGYAASCHKLQGSEFDNIILYDEPVGRTLLDRQRWYYTALTRAKKSVIIVR